MKKCFLSGTLLLCLFLSATTAGATPVDFDIAGNPDTIVSLSDVVPYGNTNLLVELNPNIGDLNHALNDHETWTVDFFTLTAVGAGLGLFNIAATLAFDTPNYAANGSGGGLWLTIPGLISGGILNWDDSALPDQFNYDGNIISIDFEDGIALTSGNSATVHAFITNMGSGSLPVPEPASMMLLGSGLIGLAAIGRKKFFRKS